MATKTTSVVFKQHDPQSVADLSGVAAARIFGVHGSFVKKLRFLELPSGKRVPIDNLGGQNLLPIFDSENMALKTVSHFSGLCLSFLFVK